MWMDSKGRLNGSFWVGFFFLPTEYDPFPSFFFFFPVFAFFGFWTFLDFLVFGFSKLKRCFCRDAGFGGCAPCRFKTMVPDQLGR